MIKQSIKMSISAIMSNKLRSFLTMLGIIIGVLTVCLVITLISSISKAILNEFGDSAEKYCSLYFRGSSVSLAKEDIQQLIFDSDLIDKACAFDTKNCSVKSSRFYGNKTVGMYSDCTLEHILDIKIQSGRGINKLDLQNGSNVAIVSNSIAVELFGDATLAIGKTFQILGWETTIVGVREKATLNEGFGADILIPESFYSSVFPTYYYSEVLVLAREADELDDCIKQIEKFLYHHYQVGDNAKRYYAISTLDGTINTIQLISTALKALMFLISAISMVIGGIGIMNIMLVSVSERTKEIGIKKSLGATKNGIISQFLLESLMICITGVLIGLSLSVLLITLLKPIVEQLLGGVNVPMLLNPGTILLSASFSIIIGVLFCLSPAKKAADLKPVEALRK